jgi:hypothetical protein
MNTTRKAELQRKLSMTPLPHPPPGLAERLKADIPQTISTEGSSMAFLMRERRTRTVASTLRMAASMLLLVSSLWVCLRVARVEEERRSRSAQFSNIVQTHEREPRYRIQRDTPPAAIAYADASRHEQVAQQKPHIVVDPTGDHPAAYESASGAGLVATANRGSETLAVVQDAAPVADPAADAESRRASKALASLPPEVSRALVDTSAAAMQIAAAAPAPPQAAVASASRSAESSLNVAEYVSVEAPSPAAPSPAILGVSVDSHAYARVKDALERGDRPAPDSVNVAALINHFTEESPRPRDRRMRVEAEGAISPFQTRNQLLRLSVDAPRTNGISNAASVASDATLTIDFDPLTTRRHRMIGGSATSDKTTSTEPAIAGGVSLTSLYEVEINPAAGKSQRVATVRLQYRSAADGKIHTVEKIIRRADLNTEWQSASVRLRIAALAGALGEGLRGHGDYAKQQLARLTHELAAQHPAEARVDELRMLVDLDESDTPRLR